MSARHTRKPLNASRCRARKRTLAVRDGAWCTYCGRLFADLRYATIDHVVPLSLLHTWRAEHTVLACKSCNDRKADRLPLLFTVLLTAAPALPESADPERAESGVHAPTGRVFTVADLVLLARVAAAHESGTWPLQSADSEAVRSGDRSMPDLRDYLRHTPVAPRVTGLRTGAVNPTVNTGEHPARLVLMAAERTPTPGACAPDSETPADCAREAA